jgi:hypothetical protein
VEKRTDSIARHTHAGMLLVAFVLAAPSVAHADAQSARTDPPPGQLIDVAGHRMHIRCVGPENATPTVILEAGGGGFYEVYNALGYGFLEQVYMAALERELRARGHEVGREVWAPVHYKGEEISKQRIDMIVDERLHFGPEPAFYRLVHTRTSP